MNTSNITPAPDSPIYPHPSTLQKPTSSLQKKSRKLKRDTLNDKKNIKHAQKQARKTEFLFRTTLNTKSKQDQDHSVTTQQSQIKKDKILMNSSSNIQNNRVSLNQLIKKPPYFTFLSNNIILGDLGHGTVIFKRPIIEGTFYLEFTVKQHEIKKQKKCQYKSAVRVGVVHYQYNPAFPIGCDESVAYKSANGSIVFDGQKIDEKQSYGVGDVLGVCLKISPPKKHPNPTQINQGSTVSFYKNGQLMLQYKSLKQTFYCFAVSLFNYASVEININRQSIYAMPAEARHYFESLNEPILYKDLEQSRIFKL